MLLNRTASIVNNIRPFTRGYSVTRPLAFARKAAVAASDKQERVNKKHLILALSEQHEMSKAKAERVFDCVMDGITAAVSDNKIVTIHQFGTFRMMRSKARTYNVPTTDRTVDVPERNRMKFKASKTLLATLQGE